MQIQNLGYFRSTRELEAQALFTEPRTSFRAKMFVFDKGIIVVAVKKLKLRYFFALNNLSIQIVSDTHLDLIDLGQQNRGLTIIVEPLKMVDIKKEFDGFQIKSHCEEIRRSPKFSKLTRKSKKNACSQGKINNITWNLKNLLYPINIDTNVASVTNRTESCFYLESN